MSNNDTFYSFGELANYLRGSLKDIESIEKRGLEEIGKYLSKKTKDKYGKKGPGWKESTSSPSSPLVKTGKLRDSIKYEVSGNTVEVYPEMMKLAVIHEFGAKWKMTDKQRKYFFAFVLPTLTKSSPRKSHGKGMIVIPARPIWRIVLKEEKKQIEGLLDDLLSSIFK